MKTEHFVILTAAGVALLLYEQHKAADAVGNAVDSFGNAINPLNPNNSFATGVNALGGSLSGDHNWTLGGWVYDLTHPAYNPNASLQLQQAVKARGTQ